MIHVSIQKQNENLQKIIVFGHAMYDDVGKDIVCSAVSTCVITTVNGIIDVDGSAIEVLQKDNRIEIEVKEKHEIATKLLENMLDILESLEQQYPKNIKLSKEEM